jgi:hypothetical protein
MTIPALQVKVAKTDARRAVREVPALDDRRLIVLVPTHDIDPARLARYIWDLAAPRGLDVLFLGLCPKAEEEFRLRRHLVTLAAVTRDLSVHVEVGIEFGRSWTRAVRRVWQVGDRVICHSEQRVGLRHRLLLDVLRASAVGPVEAISGFHTPEAAGRKESQVVSKWVMPVVVVVGVFIFQVFLPRLSAETMRTALVFMSLSAGLGLVWIWSRSLL